MRLSNNGFLIVANLVAWAVFLLMLWAIAVRS